MRGNTVAKMLSVSGRLNINMTTTVLFVMMSCKVCETISVRYCCFFVLFPRVTVALEMAPCFLDTVVVVNDVVYLAI